MFHVLQEFAGKSVSLPEVSVQMLPKPTVGFSVMSLMTFVAPMMFAMAYIFFLQFLTTILVSEKENNVKDHMMMMGMRRSAYWYSAFVCCSVRPSIDVCVKK